MSLNRQFVENMAMMTYFSDKSSEACAFRKELYSRYKDAAEAFGSDPTKLNLIKGNSDTFKALCFEPAYLAALTISRSSSEAIEVMKQSPDLWKAFESVENATTLIKKLSEHVGYNGEQFNRDSFISSVQSFNPSSLDPKPMDNDDEVDGEPVDSIGDEYGEASTSSSSISLSKESSGNEDYLGYSSSEEDLEDEEMPTMDEIEEVMGSGYVSIPKETSTTPSNSEFTESAYPSSPSAPIPSTPSTPLQPMQTSLTPKQYELADVSDILQEEKGVNDDGTEDIIFDAAALQKSKELADKEGRIDKVASDALSESSVDYEDLDDGTDVGFVADIEELVSAILNRNEAVFRSCLELDRPYGMLYEKGLLTYKVEDGTLHYKPGEGRGRSVFENLYRAIIAGSGARLLTAPDLRNVPNGKNIATLDADYYPGYIFKYALGLVDDQRYTSWNRFINALKKSLTSNLQKLYKRDLFFENLDKVEKIYSTAILVISYEPGAGIKLRVSLPGIQINTANLEAAIRTVMTYRNAGITITSVSGYQDVVDVQVLLKEDQFLNRPYWAYKAMRLKIDNGEKISLSDGLPIGRRVNGDIVEFKLDPSNRFLTFIAAGSGAGKGVLTLSLVAAAIGSQVPLFYMDFKPDMAPIFWSVEEQYNINTFTYDGMVLKRPNSDNPNHIQGFGMPAEVKKALGKYAGAIVYLKAVQLMCAMAQYRADCGAPDDIMFVFDETQAMQRLIKAAVEKTAELKKQHTPKKVKGVEEEPDTIYKYTTVLLDWFKEVNVNIDTYINTTGRKSNTFCIFIAQSPDYSTWTNLRAKAGDCQLDLLSQITFSSTIFKILGRGSTTSKYGLGGDAKKAVTEKELKYVTNNRFFGMYDGKTTDGASVTIFKPFLTLNSDDPFDKSWTKGMGKRFGYGSVPDETYVQNVAVEHAGEPGFTNSYGIHTGTGLLGLTSMYCNGDMGTVVRGFSSGWEYCLRFFNETGLISKYPSPSDYIYDSSLDGLMMVGNMVSYSPDKENSNTYGFNVGFESEADSELGDVNLGSDGMFDTGVKVPNASQQGGSVREHFDVKNNEPQTLGEAGEFVGDADPLFLKGRVVNNDTLTDALERKALEALAQEQRMRAERQVDKQEGLFEEEGELATYTESPEQVHSEPQPTSYQPQQSSYQPQQAPSMKFKQSEYRGYEEVPADVVSRITNEMLNSIESADAMETVSSMLKDDVENCYLDPITAEAVARSLHLAENGYITDYDFTTNKVVGGKVDTHRPVRVDTNGTQASRSIGKDGKNISIDTSKTSNYQVLNSDNCIDCSDVTPSGMSYFQKIATSTPGGAERYVKNLWKEILKSIIRKGFNPANITRISIYGGNMYANGKIVSLNGVLGGKQDIRLRDIVSFVQLFKSFPMIRELRIDPDILQAAILELGENPIRSLFNMGKKLEVVYLKQSDGKTIAIDRHPSPSASREEERAVFEKKMQNAVDLYCKSKSDSPKEQMTLGERIWGVKLAKSSMSRAGEVFLDKNKPSVGMALVYGTFGIAAGALGTLAWGGVTAVRKIIDLGRGFSH